LLTINWDRDRKDAHMLAGSRKTIIPHFPIHDSASIDHDLTLIIPAYNEQGRLPKTLQDVKTYLDDWGLNYRVVVVDDGSQDATATFTDNMGRRFSTIRQPNGGKGSAVRNGMLSARGSVVAFTDADLPYDLAALKSAYHSITVKRRDVVFGSRTAAGADTHVERKWLRTIASSVFRSMMTIMVSRTIKDTQCGLKAFSHHAARQIFSRTKVNGFAFDAEVVYLTHLLNLSYETVPVVLVNDYASTISLVRNSLPMLMDVVNVRWSSLRGAYRLDIDDVESLTSDHSERKAA
jgi:dolichyl-phosphate beta-glucosyltransferase